MNDGINLRIVRDVSTEAEATAVVGARRRTTSSPIDFVENSPMFQGKHSGRKYSKVGARTRLTLSNDHSTAVQNCFKLIQVNVTVGGTSRRASRYNRFFDG